MSAGGMDDLSANRQTMRDFFALRWSGRAPLNRLFFIDMLMVGTVANLVGVVAAILLMLFDAPPWLGALAYLSPLPYNIFIALAVLRTVETAAPQSPNLYRLGALIWLAAVVVV